MDKLSTDINTFAEEARAKGDLVIHAPSEIRPNPGWSWKNPDSIKIDHEYNMIKLKDLANRLRSLEFPLILDAQGVVKWDKEHKNIKTHESDYTSTSGKEIYNLLKKFKIKKLYYAGEAANICILWTREFSILQMLNNGIETYLISDLSITFSPPDKTVVSNKHDELLAFYNKHICKTVLKKEIYG